MVSEPSSQPTPSECAWCGSHRPQLYAALSTGEGAEALSAAVDAREPCASVYKLSRLVVKETTCSGSTAFHNTPRCSRSGTPYPSCSSSCGAVAAAAAAGDSPLA